MKDKDIFGKDKWMHLAVSLAVAVLSPLMALGLAIGKEYGDCKASGNHWCWWDMLADGIGIIYGTAIRVVLLYFITNSTDKFWILL